MRLSNKLCSQKRCEKYLNSRGRCHNEALEYVRVPTVVVKGIFCVWSCIRKCIVCRDSAAHFDVELRVACSDRLSRDTRTAKEESSWVYMYKYTEVHRHDILNRNK